MMKIRQRERFLNVEASMRFPARRDAGPVDRFLLNMTLEEPVGILRLTIGEEA